MIPSRSSGPAHPDKIIAAVPAPRLGRLSRARRRPPGSEPHHASYQAVGHDAILGSTVTIRTEHNAVAARIAIRSHE